MSLERLNLKIQKAEGMLCGIILKEPETLYDYTINKKLLSPSALFYVGVVERLLQKGVEVMDEVSFSSEIYDIPDLKTVYENMGGYTTVKELMETVELKNTESIIDEWTKWNLVKKYNDKGILDIEKHWDKLLQMTSGQVVDYLDFQVNDNDIQVSTDIEFETLDLTDQEIKDIIAGLNMGVNFGKHSPILNYLTMGLPKTELTMFSSYTNGGKSSYVMNSIIIPIAEQGKRVVVVANEQKSMVYKLLLQTYVLTERLDYWKLSRKKFKSGQWSEEDVKYIKKAREIIKNEYSPYISFVKLYDYDMKKVGKIAKIEAKKGAEVLVYDTMKYSGEDESTWLSLINDSKDLLQICSKNDIAGVVTYQLQIASKNRARIIDESLLSNGKQVSEVFSEMIGWRDIWQDEYSGETNDIKPYRLKRDENGKITGEKEYFQITPNSGKNYKIFFHFKTRNDNVGTCILYEFVGYQNKWHEKGYCTVQGNNRY